MMGEQDDERYLRSKGWRRRVNKLGHVRHVWTHSFYGHGYVNLQHALGLEKQRRRERDRE